MASRDPARPNVVFVLTDDQGPWALGCAGNDEIVTPNLDQLAADGVRASRFFCTSPVCSPARASLLTGRIPSQHGVHDWLDAGHSGADGIDFLAGQRLITDVAADAGYRCGLVGKWHLGANDRPRNGFVYWYSHERGGGPYYGAPMVRNGEAEVAPKYLTYVLTSEALSFIRAETLHTEPFFLAVHYTAPHSPWKDNHPTELTNLYADCAFNSCPEEPPHPWQPEINGRPIGGEHDSRAAKIGYFAAVTGVDQGVGQILDTLSELELSESTLVIFTSDNGFNCGHHGIWGKGNGTYPQNMYDSSVMVPAIFAQPGRIPGGRITDALLSGYDIFPTLIEYLSLAGRPEHDIPGRSFADLLVGKPSRQLRDRVVIYDEYGPVRMVRTRDYKYVHRWPNGPDELYDLCADLGEERNLIGQRGTDEIVSRLRQMLTSWFARYVDPNHDGVRLSVTGGGQRGPDNSPGSFL